MSKKIFERKDLQAIISRESLLHNVKALRNCCNHNVKFCAVVKANAYGHDVRKVVSILKDADVVFFAVASIYEAFYINYLADKQEILVLEPLHPGIAPEDIVESAKLGLHCSLTSIEIARYFETVLKNHDVRLKIHVNIDTGMGRCGVSISQAEELVKFIHNCRAIELAGIYTHFATADNKDLSFANQQLDLFKTTLKKLDQFINDKVIIHAANSPATIQLPDSHFDMVRCGISMYGYSTIEKPLAIELKPVLKLTAPVVHTSTIEKGQSVSYGRTFIAKRRTKIAVLALGYSDGLRRIFSNKIKLLVNEKFVPVIGNITMNQLIIDITDIPNIKPGTLVTVIDTKSFSPCSVDSLASSSNTICYEILTNIPSWVNTTII